MTIKSKPRYEENQKVYGYGLEEFEGSIQAYTRKNNKWFYIVHLIGENKNVIFEEDSLMEECR